MDLTSAEARVLGCLIEAAATTPDDYPVSLNALRLSCNRTEGRHPIVAFDDRTVEDTLLALKSKGLARFVLPRAGERGVRYSHRADDRWRLDTGELAVLAVLLVASPLTLEGVQALAGRLHPLASVAQVEALLDTLAARTPRPFATRLDSPVVGRRVRWAEALTGEGDRAGWHGGHGATVPPPVPPLPGADPRGVAAGLPPAVAVASGASPYAAPPYGPSGSPGPGPGVPVEGAPTYDELAARVAELERRLAAATAAPAIRPANHGDERRSVANRSLPAVAASPGDRVPPGLAERLADIERRLTRIEAELGALR